MSPQTKSNKDAVVLASFSAVIFDLDNSLFDEKKFIIAAYHNIASYLTKLCDHSEIALFEKLLSMFQRKTSMYPRLFDDLIEELGLNQEVLSELIKIYAHTKVDLKLFPGAEKLLKNLKKQGIKLCLVTNGNVESQKSKVQQLNLKNYFDFIIYAREMGKDMEKPNPRVYKKALQMLLTSSDETFCVGDNPYTDFWGAKKLGIRTIRLLQGEFRNVRLPPEYEAELTVRNLSELSEFLSKIIETNVS